MEAAGVTCGQRFAPILSGLVGLHLGLARPRVLLGSDLALRPRAAPEPARVSLPPHHFGV